MISSFKNNSYLILFYKVCTMICFVFVISSPRMAAASLSPKTSFRIVGGRQLMMEEVQHQFLVAFAFETSRCNIETTKHPICHFDCTGSLISKKWILSASHCLGKVKANKYNCIIGEYGPVRGITCKQNKYRDLEIQPRQIPSYIFVKVKHFVRDYPHLEYYNVKRIIRHKNAYPGGGYGVRRNIYVLNDP